MTKKTHHHLQQLALAVISSASTSVALAVEIDTGNPELKLRWDNTVKYSAAARVRGHSDALVANPNLDDGDRNFKKGVISNRFDLLSEADIGYKGFGARVSAAGWYDSLYRGNSDNDSFATSNTRSSQFPGFPEGTRKLHGSKAELLDAFVYGRFDLGDESQLNFRAGRHTLLWGESLFFGANAIAGGMAPVDVVKGLSVPNTQFKELLMPVGQVSAQLQLNSNLSIGGFIQYEWTPSRLPGAGSYFSVSDIAPATGEAFLLGPAVKEATHAQDVRAKNRGQGGFQLRWRPTDSETDFGFYAIRYHDKYPQLFMRGILTGAPAPNNVAPISYYYAYPQGVTSYGVSATRSVGEFNLGAEVSVRKNAPLVSSSAMQIPAIGVANDPARGSTWHANFNMLGALGPNFIARESAILAELAVNYTSKVTKNPGMVDPNTRRWGAGVRVSYEPTYRQVLPGLDLGVPVGIGYTPAGRSSAGGNLGSHRGGDITIGLNATYLSVWRSSLSFTHFYGREAPYLDASNHFTFGQSLKDRNFISLSIYRTF